MRASSSLSRLARSALSRQTQPQIQLRYASTIMKMPAMSPTMTEGGIAGWKKQEGESFSAGDILLEVETDKATIDVEAQDDGVMGKILVQSGSQKISVGQAIAVLAEEGDDLSNLEIPKEEAQKEVPRRDEKEPKKEENKVEKKEETPAVPAKPKHTGHKEIKHAQPLFPSVQRLLAESDLTTEQIAKLKGSGKGGMLTKGDVLVALGQLKNPWGSAEKITLDVMGPSGKRASEAKESGTAKPVKEEPLDAAAIRRLILAGMGKATTPATPVVDHTPTLLPLSSDAEFDALLAPYASLLPAPQPVASLPSPDALEASKSGGKIDEYAGLY